MTSHLYSLLGRMIDANKRRLSLARKEKRRDGIGGVYWHMARIEALENVRDAIPAFREQPK